MFNIQNLSMKIADRVLFEKVTLQLKPKHVYGLVGANGSGKSTFLKILSQELAPSSGDIFFPKYSKIGALSQDYYLYENLPIKEVVLSGKKDLYEAILQKDKLLEKELSNDDIHTLSLIEEKIQNLGGYEAESEIETLLSGLGINLEKQEETLASFSGGYKVRVMLAKLLFDQPDLLLLDEPTNYLDIETIKWFASYLTEFKGSVVVCSHDRQFLNDVSLSIIDLDFGMLKIYPGNYEDFVELKKEEVLQKGAALANISKKQKQLSQFVEKFGAKATKAKQAKSKEKIINRLEMEKLSHELLPSSRCYPNFFFQVGGRLPAIFLKVKNLSKSYGNHQVLNHVSFEVQRDEKVAIIGANGIGKSTILEIITGDKQADLGSFEFADRVQVGYFPQLFEKKLDFEQRLFEFLKNSTVDVPDQKIYDALGKMLFHQDDFNKKIKVLSGGEKARLYLCTIMLREVNVLIFDEPTNHLDMESSEMLLKALIEFPGAVLFVSHNRFFIENLASRVIEIRHEKIVSHLGGYQTYLDAETENETIKNISSSNSKKQNSKQKKTSNKNQLIECEKAINSSELELEKINSNLSKPGFYETTTQTEQQKLLNKREELENKLNELYQKWEQLTD